MNTVQAKGWFPGLDAALASGDIQGFLTKKAALAVAREFGWGGSVLRVERRFERVWIVGRCDFQNDMEGDIPFDVLRAPALRWEVLDGIKRQPVVTLRRPAT